MEHTENFDFCHHLLLDGERILWQGRPEKGHIFTRQDIVLVPFGLFVLLFALIWEYAALQTSPSLLGLFGLPVVLVGLYMLFGRWIQAAYLRNKTFYVVTNQKIIIKRGSRIIMHNSRDLPSMEIELHKNGNGTILFSDEVTARNGRRRLIYFALENLADAVQAQNAIQQMDR